MDQWIRTLAGAAVGIECLLGDLAIDWDLPPRRRRAMLTNALRMLPPERRVPLVATLVELGERWIPMGSGEESLALLGQVRAVAADAAAAVVASIGLATHRQRLQAAVA